MSYFLTDHSVERTLLLDGNAYFNHNQNQNFDASTKQFSSNKNTFFQQVYGNELKHHQFSTDQFVDPGTDEFEFPLNEDVYIRKFGLKWASIPFNFESFDDETEIVLMLHSQGQILNVTLNNAVDDTTLISPRVDKKGAYFNHIILPSNETQSSEEMNFISTNIIVEALRKLLINHFSTANYIVRPISNLDTFPFNFQLFNDVDNYGRSQNANHTNALKSRYLLKKSLADLQAHSYLQSLIFSDIEITNEKQSFFNQLTVNYDTNFNQILINIPNQFRVHPTYYNDCRVLLQEDTYIVHDPSHPPILYLPQHFTLSLHAIPKLKVNLKLNDIIFDSLPKFVNVFSHSKLNTNQVQDQYPYQINQETLQNLTYLTSATFGLPNNSFNLQQKVTLSAFFNFLIRYYSYTNDQANNPLNYFQFSFKHDALNSFNPATWNTTNTLMKEFLTYQLPAFNFQGAPFLEVAPLASLFTFTQWDILHSLPDASFLNAKVLSFQCFLDHIQPAVNQDLQEAFNNDAFRSLFVYDGNASKLIKNLPTDQQQYYNYVSVDPVKIAKLNNYVHANYNFNVYDDTDPIQAYFRGDIKSFPLSFYPTSRGMNYIVLHTDLMQSSTVKPININVIVPKSNSGVDMQTMSLTRDSTILAYIPFTPNDQFGQRVLYQHNADKDYLIPCVPNQVRKVKFWFTTPAGKKIKFFAQYPTILLNIIDC